MHAETLINYDLSKKVPDMRRGFTIETRYGSIEVGPDDAEAFARLVEVMLERQRLELQS